MPSVAEFTEFALDWDTISGIIFDDANLIIHYKNGTRDEFNYKSSENSLKVLVNDQWVDCVTNN